MAFLDKVEVSVVIPVYNVDKYLDSCLESLLKSMKDNIEVILVDDGSTDKSPIICDKYAKNYSFIRVIHKENGGLSSARNAGINIARGNWIAFIDSDDLVTDNYCLAILEFINKCSNAEIIMFNYATFYDNKRKTDSTQISDPVKLNKDTAMYYLTTEKWGNYFWCKIFRKKLFTNIKLPIGRNYEDIATMYKYFDLAKFVYASDTILYLYRQRADSIIHAKDLKKEISALKDSILSRSEQLIFLKKNNFIRAQKLAEYYLWHVYCSYILIVQDNNLKKDKYYKEAIEFNKNYKESKLSIKEKIMLNLINFNPSIASLIHRKF